MNTKKLKILKAYSSTATYENGELLIKDNKIVRHLNGQFLILGDVTKEMLDAAVLAEETRAKGVESTLSTAIGTEETRAKGVESTLTGSIEDLVDELALIKSLQENGKNIGVFNTLALLNAVTGKSGNYAYVKEDESHSGETWLYAWVDATNTWGAIVRVNEVPRDFTAQPVELSELETALQNAINGAIQDTQIKDTAPTAASTDDEITSAKALYTLLGELSELETSDKTSLVGAINSVALDLDSSIQKIYTKVGTYPFAIGIGNQGGCYLSYKLSIGTNTVINYGIDHQTGFLSLSMWSSDFTLLCYAGETIDLQGNKVIFTSNSEDPHVPLGVNVMFQDDSIDFSQANPITITHMPINSLKAMVFFADAGVNRAFEIEGKAIFGSNGCQIWMSVKEIN
jgi:hypothetical protein